MWSCFIKCVKNGLQHIYETLPEVLRTQVVKTMQIIRKMAAVLDGNGSFLLLNKQFSQHCESPFGKDLSLWRHGSRGNFMPLYLTVLVHPTLKLSLRNNFSMGAPDRFAGLSHPDIHAWRNVVSGSSRGRSQGCEGPFFIGKSDLLEIDYWESWKKMSIFHAII